ncbi:MAG: hypothetical protein KC589_04020 [Nanoarchaeota archaeon]|nr:hypothetical protein [Nanoarchaeota archaeon]
MNNNSNLYNNTLQILSNFPEIEIKNSKIWKLANYNFTFGEIVIDFKKSDISCPQGFLFEDPNSKNFICGASNLFDLRQKLSLKYHAFDTLKFSTDIFLRRKQSSDKLEERVIINSGEPLIISKEEAALMNYENLKKAIDLSPNSRNKFTRKKDRERLARLYNYIRNDHQNEYYPGLKI